MTTHDDLPGQLYLFGPPDFLFIDRHLEEIRKWGANTLSEDTVRGVRGTDNPYIVDFCPHEQSAFHPEDWGCPEEKCRCGHD